MPSDPRRIDQVYRDIQRLRDDCYSAFFRPHARREGAFVVGDRSWQELPEPTKLIVLEQMIDWSGISARVQARMLLAEIDPAGLADEQRSRLIAAAGEPDDERDLDRRLAEYWRGSKRAGRGKEKDK